MVTPLGPLAWSPVAPVLLHEAVAAVSYSSTRLVVDATFGAGDYSRALLNKLPTSCSVLAMDPIDIPSVAEAAVALTEDDPAGRFTFVQGHFDDILPRLTSLPEAKGLIPPEGVDAFLFDLGESTTQLSKSDRRLSFKEHVNAQLDDEMAGEADWSAVDLVNNLTESQLASLLRQYTDEDWAKRLA
eukprot:NODE_828_length_1165_cov_274.555556_g583_i0.p1 GENE.NODE_828_length_1165_cov_274.555556_g583_i0~~NODE_828_length_1165_cov_274.555556_g583_i0.p1  ORF type:complete len:186 (-),score=25.94 NODE_828_length_1165_cov_274.555556_g583_i0:473-1030(-)